MHSSRMRIARLLPGEVCIQRGLLPEGLHWQGGGSAGGRSAGGGSASGVAVCLQGFMQTPSPCGQKNTCENITLPQTSFVTIEIPISGYAISAGSRIFLGGGGVGR